LEIVTHESSSAEKTLAFDHNASKVKLSGIEALITTSFQLLIPSVFGSTAGASTGKALPNVKDFRTWDPKSSYDGDSRRALPCCSCLLLVPSTSSSGMWRRRTRRWLG
jgi:hypothetical protein